MTVPGDIIDDVRRIRRIAEEPGQTVAACFQELTEICCFRTAIIGASWQPTYGELDALTNTLAHALLKHGAVAGGRVAVLMRHDGPLIAGVLAALKAGATVLVLNPTDPPARLGEVLDDAEPSILLTDLANYEQATRIARVRQNVVRFEDHAVDLGMPVPDLGVTPGDVAFLIYTSGSTGRPRGVMRTHGDLVHQVLRLTRGLDLRTDDRVALLGSLSGGQGMITTWCALLNGAALCPFPVASIGVAGFADWLLRHRITDYFSSASLFRHFMKTLPDGFVFPDMRLVRLGSEPATAADFAMFREHFGANCLFFHTLSSSETGNICQLGLRHDAQVPEGRLPVGFPAEGVEVLLLDEAGAEVPDGTVGEIAVRSRHLSAGYWRDAAQTESRYSKVEGANGATVFRSGDLARRLPDAQILIVGRADHRVKIRGYRIELSEVEDALNALANVERGVVLAVPQRGADLGLAAFIELRAGHEVSVEDLRGQLGAVLPSHMIPTQYSFVVKMPLTAHGKVDRNSLLSGLAPVPDSSHGGAPRSGTERMLAEVWREVFSREDIGRESCFFELGGDSLVAVVIAARVYAVSQVTLALESFALHHRLKDLAAEIDALSDRGETQAIPPLRPVPRDTLIPLSYQQELIWNFSRSPDGMAGYIMSHHCRFRGRLDVGILRQSLDYLAGRHEALRTTFAVHGGGPVQMIHPPGPVEMVERDFSGAGSPQEAARAERHEELTRPINLERGPLVRFILSRLRDDEFWLQTVHHHLISDGWSWHVFFRELGLVYDGLVQGQIPPLPPNQPLHYADYAHWQRATLHRDGASWRRTMEWWKGVFADAARPVELIFRRKVPLPDAPPVEGFVTREIPAGVSKGLERVTRDEKATFYAVRLAALGAVISAATGQDDMIIGAYVSDRSSVQTQGMFGFFSNAASLRLRIDETLTFRHYVRSVSRLIHETQAHSGVPYQQLCNELARQGISSPEIRVIAKVGSSREPRRLHGVELDWPASTANVAMPWGFSLTFQQRSEGESCFARFDSRLYEPNGAAAMVDTFVRLLQEAAERPDEALGVLLDAVAAARPARGSVEPGMKGMRPPREAALEADRLAQLVSDAGVVSGEITRFVRPDGPLLGALRADPWRSGGTVLKQRSSIVAEMGDENLFQFHGVEFDRDRAFRWSQPVSAVRIHPPRHSDRVTIRLHPFAPSGPAPTLWLEGRLLPFLGRQGLRLEFEVPAKSIPAHPAWLVLVVPPFQSGGDSRPLGLPLHRIKFDSSAVRTRESAMGLSDQ